jgi:hypothetical protein
MGAWPLLAISVTFFSFRHAVVCGELALVAVLKVANPHCDSFDMWVS